MIKHIWSLICQNIIVDRNTNSISYINCLEELTVPPLPVDFSLSLGIFTHIDPIEVFKIRIRLKKPDGTIKELIVTEDYKLKTKKNRINFILGITFDSSGEYHFLIDIKTDNVWESFNEIPLEVKVNKAGS